MSWWMLKNSRGRKDFLLSVAFAGTTAVLAKVLLSGVVIGSYTFGQIDSTLAGIVLAATLTPYTTKRIKGGKNDEEVKS